jgi:hypothetical protein
MRNQARRSLRGLMRNQARRSLRGLMRSLRGLMRSLRGLVRNLRGLMRKQGGLMRNQARRGAPDTAPRLVHRWDIHGVVGVLWGSLALLLLLLLSSFASRAVEERWLRGTTSKPERLDDGPAAHPHATGAHCGGLDRQRHGCRGALCVCRRRRSAAGAGAGPHAPCSRVAAGRVGKEGAGSS